MKTYSLSYNYSDTNDLIGFAGIPPYNQPSLSRFFVTTEPAATITIRAIVTPGITIQQAPNQTPSPMTTGAVI